MSEAGSTLPQQPPGDVDRPRGMKWLVALGVASWVLYAVFCWLSRDFGYDTAGPDRPILPALGVLAAAFVLYLAALWIAVRLRAHRDLTCCILLFAAGFRVTLLFTEPFQEIDIYRYLWDGHVTSVGVSPFRYAPREVIDADANGDMPDDLRRLVALRDSDPALCAILQRVHYNDLPTVYPATSQAVFALSAHSEEALAAVSSLWNPSRGDHSRRLTHEEINRDVRTKLVVLKFWIVLFDLGTLWLVILILKYVGKPTGWAVAYGWCPLAVKEFANSGHLDSIAVFLTTAAVWAALRAFFPRGDLSGGRRVGWSCTAAILLALAIGAKLYPVVLAPALFLSAVKRAGWTAAILSSVCCLALTSALMWPMVNGDLVNGENVQADRIPRLRVGLVSERVTPAVAVIQPPLPPGFSRPGEKKSPGKHPAPPPHSGETLQAPIPGHTEARGDKPNEPKGDHDPAKGLKVFLSRWQMNDFLFMLLDENLTPMHDVPDGQRPWFVITPESWRQDVVQRTQHAVNSRSESLTGKRTDITEAEAAFLLTRAVTALIFLALAVWFAVRSLRDDSPGTFLRFVFLTLAWFWLLSPTLNPWYWTWALPFLPFARGRAWTAMSGLVLAYYLRFWFQHHMASETVWFTRYAGVWFQDFVVVWLEFGPWFVWLAAEAILRKRAGGDSRAETG